MKSSFNVSLDDEIEIMSIRVLNFSEEKCPADLTPYWHQVSQGAPANNQYRLPRILLT
jgi:hypothetical protein